MEEFLLPLLKGLIFMRDEMEQRTFGVELEFGGITRPNAIRVVKEVLINNLLCDYAETIVSMNNCYHSLVVKDSRNRKWSIQRDSSVADGGSTSCELVTPILWGTCDILLLQDIVRAIRKKGGRVDKSCGMHVHIGAQDFTPQKLRILANMWHSRQPILYAGCLVNSENRNVGYCKPLSDDFIDRLNKVKPQDWLTFWQQWYRHYYDVDNYNDVNLVRLMHYNSSRYHSLNFHSFNMRKTIEFRLFNGTLHAGKVKTAIQLCLALVCCAKEKTKATSKVPDVVRQNPAFAMRTWLNQLGLTGDEYETLRHFMYLELPGNAAWRYGKPTKRRGHD